MTAVSQTGLVRAGLRQLDALAFDAARLGRGALSHPPAERASLVIGLRILDNRLARAEAALARLNFSGPDNWEEQAGRADDTLRALRLAVGLVEADLAALAADEPAAYGRALDVWAQAWQSYAEDLALAAHVAGLDVRPELDGVTRAVRRIRHGSVGAGATWDQLRGDTDRHMAEARRVVAGMQRRLDGHEPGRRRSRTRPR